MLFTHIRHFWYVNYDNELDEDGDLDEEGEPIELKFDRISGKPSTHLSNPAMRLKAFGPDDPSTSPPLRKK